MRITFVLRMSSLFPFFIGQYVSISMNQKARPPWPFLKSGVLQLCALYDFLLYTGHTFATCGYLKSNPGQMTHFHE